MAKVKKAQLGNLVKKYKNWEAKNESDKNYTRSSFKTADSLRSATPKGKDKMGLPDRSERDRNRAKADSIEKAVEKRVGVPRSKNLYEQKNGGKTVKKKK